MKSSKEADMDDMDDLRAFRGILFAMAASLAAWGLILLALLWALGKFGGAA